jgi:hypothetical protein
VANPADYPATGMGGVNFGPEFTATELAALHELCTRESRLANDKQSPALSGFKSALEATVVDSNRWLKWLTPDEVG